MELDPLSPVHMRPPESDLPLNPCGRACFKKNSPLHVSSKIYPSWLLYPRTREICSYRPSKILMTFLIVQHITPVLHTITKSSVTSLLFLQNSLIHHCKSSLSSLHIFVHHCTFCASMHVKTSPACGRHKWMAPYDYNYDYLWSRNSLLQLQ